MIKLKIINESPLSDDELKIKELIKKELKDIIISKLDYDISNEDDKIILKGIISQKLNDYLNNHLILNWKFNEGCFMFINNEKIYFISLIINDNIYIHFMIKVNNFCTILDGGSLKKLFDEIII